MAIGEDKFCREKEALISGNGGVENAPEDGKNSCGVSGLGDVGGSSVSLSGMLSEENKCGNAPLIQSKNLLKTRVKKQSKGVVVSPASPMKQALQGAFKSWSVSVMMVVYVYAP